MRFQLSTVFLLAASSDCLHAQTVLASSDRYLNRPFGGEAVFTVRVTAATDRSMSEVLAALDPAGILEQDLVGRKIGRLPDAAPGLLGQYLLFRFARPANRFAGTQSLLQGFAAAGRDMTLTFSGRLQPSQADIDLARAEVLPALFRETKARAEIMLIEAGYRPGAIVELVEWIEPREGAGVRLSLSLRMARLGAAAAVPASVSTVVTPPSVPYRLSAPLLTASYSVSPPQTRARLLEMLAPAGLGEAQLTNVITEPYRTSPLGYLEVGPVNFTNQFAAPVAEADIPSRLGRLPLLEGGGAEVEYPVSPAAVDQAALASAAQSRATLLAGLLGAKLGEGLGMAADEPARAPFISRSGNFLIHFRRNLPGQIAIDEPIQHPGFRYRFAVINE